MANELTHKDPGAELTQAEYITTSGTGHIFASQAAGDILYASSTTVLTRLGKGADGTVLELASGLPAWTASPTIGATSWANAGHAHAASNSGGTIAITATTGTLAVANGGTGATELTNLITLATHTTGNFVATVANATNGGTTIANSGAENAGITITINLNDLTAAAVDVANDSIAIIDANATNGTRKESIADLATAMAGTNLTATSGVLAASGGGIPNPFFLS
tara:strand:+ start:51 stop:722 length:672 start_codon:yes stop_codon:yes gene_type:complete